MSTITLNFKLILKVLGCLLEKAGDARAMGSIVSIEIRDSHSGKKELKVVACNSNIYLAFSPKIFYVIIHFTNAVSDPTFLLSPWIDCS